MRKRMICVLLSALLCLTACGGSAGRSGGSDGRSDDGRSEYDRQERDERDGAEDGDTWAVYWYLCGSDLESNYGAATGDLVELMEVELPENVKVVIQTGGAYQWHNDLIDAGAAQRYVYDSEGLTLVDEQPAANMGEMETLAEFLDFCADNYPADRTMALFWNHGGGSVAGAAFDETYGFDSLTLGEMYWAFNDVFDLSVEDPPLDVIGFDTCLMATIDVAYTFMDVGKYLVASEEMEPGNGWYYAGWLEELARDPSMDGEELGVAICDTYVEGCELAGTGDEITLSVTDLGRLGPLLESYESLGAEALSAALENPAFFPAFGREAMRSESYGGNTPDTGYTNMVDLGHLVRNCAEILPENARAVLDALDSCVVYKVNGPYRAEATGLSCYYSYNGSVEDFYGYVQEGVGSSFKYLYGYGLGGELSEDGMAYINSLGYGADDLQEAPTLESAGLEDYPVYVDDNGCAVLDIGPWAADLLTGVYFQLCYVDMAADILLLLGRDNNIDMDWDNGVFLDNFWGYWGSIDGYLVYMELIYEGEDYNTYSVPVLLNGEEYNLRVVYDYNDGQYYILGARRGLDDTGMADKNLVQLQPGDVLTTIHYAATISGDDDFVPYEVDTFTVTEDTAFYDVDMGDGDFMMMFEMVDARNQSAYSQMVLFTVEGGEIWTEVL